MKILLLSLLVSLPAHAGEALVCVNPATGAELRIYRDSSDSSGTRFKMSSELVAALERQGGAHVVANDTGSFNYGGGDEIFSAGAAHAYSLELVRDSGGMKLRYFAYAGGRSEFFFNPGECLFR